jgi:MoaA/NifB/PqqE/SkfB family radical SAM enzyme
MRKVMHDPALLYRWLDMRVRDNLTRYTYPYTLGWALPPRMLSFTITSRCNLRCQMCRRWQIEGDFNALSGSKRDIDEDLFRSIIDEVAGSRPWINFSGGEPTLHRGLLSMVRYVRERGLLCDITSNGAVLAKKAQALVDADPTAIAVSIDGPREIHDEIRGVKGTFDKALRGIEAVHEARERAGKPNPEVWISFTVSNINLSHAVEMLEIARKYGVRFNLSQLWFCTPRMVEDHNRAHGQELPAIPQDVEYLDPTIIDERRLIEVMSELERRANGHPLTFEPSSLGPRSIGGYYSEAERFIGPTKCRFPWNGCTVLADGTLMVCLNHLNIELGKAGDRGFLAAWNSPRARAFRRQLAREGTFPICARCCNLYQP